MEEIGNGAFGTVYRLDALPGCTNWPQGKPVACKRMAHDPKDEEQCKMVRRECALLKHLSVHPGLRRVVPQLYSTKVTPSMTHIYMEYFPMSVAQFYDQHNKRMWRDMPVNVRKATFTSLAAQIIGAFHCFHESGLLHRDLKLPNMLLDPATGRLVIADWGLARHFAHAEQNRPYWYYTVPYRCLEVLLGGIYGKEADVYSVGVVIFELFAWGFAPWHYTDRSFTDIGQCFVVAMAIGGTVAPRDWITLDTPAVGGKRKQSMEARPPSWKPRSFSDYMQAEETHPRARERIPHVVKAYKHMPLSLKALLDNIITAASKRYTMAQVKNSAFATDAQGPLMPLHVAHPVPGA